MRDILHLLDDNQLGGVTRLLQSLLAGLPDGGAHRVLVVQARLRLAPSLILPETGRAPDVIVVHLTMAWNKLPFLASLRSRAPQARIVLVEHSYTAAFERHCVRHVARFRLMLRQAYRMADRVVAVSHGQAAWMREHALVAPRKLVVIANACDAEAFAAVPPLTEADRPVRLGAYGRYTTQKGFDLLIEAMKLVPPSYATLTLAGLGPDHAVLVAAAADLPHVRVLGPADPASFLAGVDAVIVPSRWEGYGLVAAEARAAGRPVLAASVDGLVEQLDPAWGILFEPDHPLRIAAAIHEITRRNLPAMGAAARGSVSGALEAMTLGWQALLGEVAVGRLAARAPGSAAQTPAIAR